MSLYKVIASPASQKVCVLEISAESVAAFNTQCGDANEVFRKMQEIQQPFTIVSCANERLTLMSTGSDGLVSFILNSHLPLNKGDTYLVGAIVLASSGHLVLSKEEFDFKALAPQIQRHCEQRGKKARLISELMALEINPKHKKQLSEQKSILNDLAQPVLSNEKLVSLEQRSIELNKRVAKSKAHVTSEASAAEKPKVEASNVEVESTVDSKEGGTKTATPKELITQLNTELVALKKELNGLKLKADLNDEFSELESLITGLQRKTKIGKDKAHDLKQRFDRVKKRIEAVMRKRKNRQENKPKKPVEKVVVEEKTVEKPDVVSSQSGPAAGPGKSNPSKKQPTRAEILESSLKATELKSWSMLSKINSKYITFKPGKTFEILIDNTQLSCRTLSAVMEGLTYQSFEKCKEIFAENAKESVSSVDSWMRGLSDSDLETSNLMFMSGELMAFSASALDSQKDIQGYVLMFVELLRDLSRAGYQFALRSKSDRLEKEIVQWRFILNLGDILFTFGSELKVSLYTLKPYLDDLLLEYKELPLRLRQSVAGIVAYCVCLEQYSMKLEYDRIVNSDGATCVYKKPDEIRLDGSTALKLRKVGPNGQDQIVDINTLIDGLDQSTQIWHGLRNIQQLRLLCHDIIQFAQALIRMKCDPLLNSFVLMLLGVRSILMIKNTHELQTLETCCQAGHIMRKGVPEKVAAIKRRLIQLCTLDLTFTGVALSMKDAVNSLLDLKPVISWGHLSGIDKNNAQIERDIQNAFIKFSSRRQIVSLHDSLKSVFIEKISLIPCDLSFKGDMELSAFLRAISGDIASDRDFLQKECALFDNVKWFMHLALRYAKIYDRLRDDFVARYTIEDKSKIHETVCRAFQESVDILGRKEEVINYRLFEVGLLLSALTYLIKKVDSESKFVEAVAFIRTGLTHLSIDVKIQNVQDPGLVKDLPPYLEALEQTLREAYLDPSQRTSIQVAIESANEVLSEIDKAS